MSDVRKGYKAFGHGMVCRGKQYAENTVFEEQGEVIKADTWYELKNGEFVEVAKDA